MTLGRQDRGPAQRHRESEKEEGGGEGEGQPQYLARGQRRRDGRARVLEAAVAEAAALDDRLRGVGLSRLDSPRVGRASQEPGDHGSRVRYAGWCGAAC